MKSPQTSRKRPIQRVQKPASVEELAASLVQEMRNPLAGIKTAVQVLAEKIRLRDGDDGLREVVDEVNAQTERVRRLVDDLLQLCKARDRA